MYVHTVCVLKLEERRKMMMMTIMRGKEEEEERLEEELEGRSEREGREIKACRQRKQGPTGTLSTVEVCWSIVG